MEREQKLLNFENLIYFDPDNDPKKTFQIN